MAEPSSQGLTSLSYWTVVEYYVDTKKWDSGGIERNGDCYEANCSGEMMVDVGPLVEGQFVHVSIEDKYVIFTYHPTLLRPDEEEGEEEEFNPRAFLRKLTAEERTRDDFFEEMTETYMMKLVPPVLEQA
jgi:hypothetical protein